MLISNFLEMIKFMTMIILNADEAMGL